MTDQIPPLSRRTGTAGCSRGPRLSKLPRRVASYRIGADENGLGARLGPMVVTAVLARLGERGERTLGRRLPKRVSVDLADSKRLLSHGNIALGEAWARALTDDAADCPAALFERLSLEGTNHLRSPCPSHAEDQCWSVTSERFVSDVAIVDRLKRHLAWLRERDVDVLGVRTSVLCTKRLNDARAEGKNRFVADLHAMERLVLHFREHAGEDLHAVCGKVGGIDDYSRFFGPLSYRLHAVIRQGRPCSAYHFPGLGEIHFVRDADDRDPLVMLASLVGKYVRELLMARVFDYYHAQHEDDLESVSGYHDPATTRFVELTAPLRRLRVIPDTCFERSGHEEA